MFYFSLKCYSEDIDKEALLFGTPMYVFFSIMTLYFMVERNYPHRIVSLIDDTSFIAYPILQLLPFNVQRYLENRHWLKKKPRPYSVSINPGIFGRSRQNMKLRPS